MNKILNTVPGILYGFQHIEIPNGPLLEDLANSIARTNTYCPEVSRVIFNVGTKAYPIRDANGKFIKLENGKLKYGDPVKVLTTVVFFVDGTKVAVTNSENDGITFEPAQRKIVTVDENTGKKTVKYEDRGFEVATKSSKEAGLVYAIAKRLLGMPDKNGNVDGKGFGRRLNMLVDNAYDTTTAEHDRKEAKAKAKAAYNAKVGTAKKRRPSLAESVDRLADMLDRIELKFG